MHRGFGKLQAFSAASRRRQDGGCPRRHTLRPCPGANRCQALSPMGPPGPDRRSRKVVEPERPDRIAMQRRPGIMASSRAPQRRATDRRVCCRAYLCEVVTTDSGVPRRAEATTGPRRGFCRRPGRVVAPAWNGSVGESDAARKRGSLGVGRRLNLATVLTRRLPRKPGRLS